MTHVTYRLTAKNRGQLWNPMLGNRVQATFLRTLNPEKIRHKNLTDLPTLPVRCSHFTLGNPKSHFQQYYLNTSDYCLYLRSRAALTGKHDTLVRRAHQMLNAALLRRKQL